MMNPPRRLTLRPTVLFTVPLAAPLQIEVSVVAREEDEPHFETLLASAVRPV